MYGVIGWQRALWCYFGAAPCQWQLQSELLRLHKCSLSVFASWYTARR